MIDEMTVATDIGTNKLFVQWGAFTVVVGDHSCWAYHARPTHITETLPCVPEECGCKKMKAFEKLYADPEYVHMVQKQRKLDKDEPCPVTVYSTMQAFEVAYRKWKALENKDIHTPKDVV